MRPLSLKLDNFGPFLNEELNFEDLNDSLFLITGPTGSGKSTVFDGICYALYGESSQSDKPVDQLKSHFADPGATMSVRYTFAIQNKIYSILRIPEQERKSQRGEGLARQSHEATLFEMVGDQEVVLASSVSKVASMIDEIVGLNASQFRQIVMLPQGEFSKLLKSKQGEKEKLLKSIFNMKLFEDFKQEVGLRYRAIRGDNEVKRKQLESETSHLIWPKERITEEKHEEDVVKNAETLINQDIQAVAENAQAIAQLEKSIADAEEYLQYKRDLERDFIELKEALEKEKDLQGAREEMRTLEIHYTRSQNVLSLRPLYTEWQRGVTELREAEKRLLQLEADKKQKESDLKVAEKKHLLYQSDAYRSNLDKRQKNIDNLAIYIDYVKRQSKLETEIKKYTDALIALEEEGKKYSDLDEKKEKLTIEKETRDKTAIAALKKENELSKAIQDLETQIKALETLEDLEKTLAQQKTEKEKLTTQYKELQQQGKILKEELLSAEAAMEHEKAAALSGSLKVGEPCPVCGSTHHPSPAKALESLDHNRYQSLKNRWESLRDQLTAVKTNGSNVSKRIKEQEDKRDGHLKSWPDFHNVDLQNYPMRLNALKDNHNALSKQQERLKEEQQRLTEQESALNEREALLKTYLEEKAPWEEKRNNLRAQLGEERGKEKENAKLIEEKALDLTAVDLTGNLKERMTTMEAQLTEEKQRQTQAQTDFIQGQNDYNKLLSERDHVKDRIETLKDENLDYQEKVEAALVKAHLTHEDFKVAPPSAAQMALDKEKLEQYRSEKNANAQNIQSLEKRLAGKTREDLKPLEEALKEKRERHIARHQEKTLREERIQQNQKTLKKVVDLKSQLKQGEKREVFYQALEQTVRGTLSGSKRISFERFILAAYLQDILDASNDFLHRMSSGRYLLKTRGWETGGGLEIEVEDAYTGKVRSADTLSGGETFMAALSMAMGLSDTIQSKSGGIVLETIFIDEGFATLDPIALDKSIESLVLLQSMHRGVGVISHVQGLKDRIDCKIQIEKTEEGSYIHTDTF